MDIMPGICATAAVAPIMRARMDENKFFIVYVFLSGVSVSKHLKK
jgi:hypothetical protein